MMNKLLSKWTTWQKLDRSEKRLFLHAWLLLLRVDLALRRQPFEKVRRGLGRGLEGEGAVEQPHKLAWDTWRVVSAAAHHHLYEMTCLRRALVLQRLLAEQGLGVGMYIGVRKEAGKVLAHAWIEVEGEAVGEARGVAQEFVPMLRLETAK